MALQSDELTIRLCGVEPESIVDGPGFRFSVFCQGCPHHCSGCHNPQTHSFTDGYDMKVTELAEEILKNKHLYGATFSGGEPFCQAKAYAYLGKLLKAEGLHIMTYTGFTYEQLKAKNDPDTEGLLSVTDILVDGRFEEKLRDLTALFRGSSNQRLIDMKATREKGVLCLLEEEDLL